MAFKFWHYFAFSSFMMLSMIVYACYSREQFYPIVLLLLTSKISFVLMANMAFALALLIGKVGIKTFFGQLRDIEWELIFERSKYSITETCLALTIFRSELSPTVFAFFLGLLFVKIFHWLSRSRLDYLEQVAQVSAMTHTALLVVLVLLVAVDSAVCYQCITYSVTKGRTVIVLFAFEFGALILDALNNLIRYIVNAIDNSLANGLNYKGLYFMILDLICGGLRFCTYAAFFCLVFVYYGLPIHIVRDVWMSFIVFYERLVSLIRYLKLTSNLEERLEDATPEELAQEENCLICREGMDRGKKLPCKHIYHIDCLRVWLQHRQTCPLCRADIPITNVRARREAAAGHRAQPPGLDPDGAANGAAAGGDTGGEGDRQHPLDDVEDLDAGLNHVFPGGVRGEQRGGGGHREHRTGVQAPTAANAPSEPSSSGLRDPSSLFPSFSADVYKMKFLKKSIPGFFIVVDGENNVSGGEGVNVREQPGVDGTNGIVRMIDKETVVFVTEFISIRNDLTSLNHRSIVWLHIPDGWVPMETAVAVGENSMISLPLLRPFSPDEDTQAMSSVGTSSGSCAYGNPSDEVLNLLAVSATSRDRVGSMNSTSRPASRSAGGEGDSRIPSASLKSSKGYPPRVAKTPSSSPAPNKSGSGSSASKRSSPSTNDDTNAAISDAIMKAREDISLITRSLREASSDHSKVSARHANRYHRLPSHMRTPERRFGSTVVRHGGNSSARGSGNDGNYAVRIERLIAMQQHIDDLSNSIADIQDALSMVRTGLVDALTDELVLQESQRDEGTAGLSTLSSPAGPSCRSHSEGFPTATATDVGANDEVGAGLPQARRAVSESAAKLTSGAASASSSTISSADYRTEVIVPPPAKPKEDDVDSGDAVSTCSTEEGKTPLMMRAASEGSSSPGQDEIRRLRALRFAPPVDAGQVEAASCADSTCANAPSQNKDAASREMNY